jgi:hypothetical protein
MEQISDLLEMAPAEASQPPAMAPMMALQPSLTAPSMARPATTTTKGRAKNPELKTKRFHTGTQNLFISGLIQINKTQFTIILGVIYV